MFRELKVLELASVLAGPTVGQFFAELGAEVIKIENLKAGGDVTRTWNPTISRKLAAMHAFARSQGFLLATVEKTPPMLGNDDV